MSNVRLYGSLNGYGSQAQVTRGFMGALSEARKLAGVVGLDQDDPPGVALPAGVTAKHGVFTGPHAFIPRMQSMGAHDQRWVMLAPNSDTLPRNLIQAIEGFGTDVMVPSRWGAEVAAAHTKLPVHVVPHGLDPAFQPAYDARRVALELYKREYFHVVHFSTSARERKATLQLAEAWEMLLDAGKLPPRAELALVLDYESSGRYYEWGADRGKLPPRVRVVPRMDAEPTQMASTLALIHVVCQPSRGEGFGMVPLEARACGVPVVATTCTGHSEHLMDGMPGVVAVVHGPLAPIDDMPGAKAPSVSRDAIAGALMQAYERYPMLDGEAQWASKAVRAEWSWGARLAPWMKEL